MADKALHEMTGTTYCSTAVGPDVEVATCSCGWIGRKADHAMHRADSRPQTSLPSDTIDALSGVQYHAAWFLQVFDEVQASAAPLELPQRLTERINDMREQHQRFLDVRDGGESGPPTIVHDLTARSIAHEVARQHPKSEDEAEALARRVANGLGMSGMKFTRAVDAAMETWRAIYSDPENEGIAEAHEIPHADLAVASRAVLLQTGDVQLATLYAVMALYGALSERP